MIQQTSPGSHSAIVKMSLELDGRRIEVVQSGPDFVLLRTPCELPAGEAILVTTINDAEVRSPLTLRDGATLDSCLCRLG